MSLKAGVWLVSALLVLAWAFASSASEAIDIGDGLLLRPDGTVIAAWELPGCEAAADAFDAPQATIGMPASSRDVWQMRFDRGW